MNGWIADQATEIAETARLARQAVEFGKKDAVALSMGGFALAFVVGEVEDGAAFIDQALTLNPNLATGWLLRIWVTSFLGKPELQTRNPRRPPQPARSADVFRIYPNWRQSYAGRPL